MANPILKLFAALNASVVQAERRYTNGHSPFLELLDARRALYDAQLAQTEAVRDRLTAMAVLFKALGGGWEVRQNDSVVPERTRHEMEERTDWGDMLSPPPRAGAK